MSEKNPSDVARRVPKQKNILRIDYPSRGMYGYLVRVQWQGQRKKGWFSDVQYGDRLGALDAAIRFKAQAYAELRKPPGNTTVVGKSRSNTGHVGITRRIKSGKAIYEAFWTEEGKRRSASFSIAEHGERKALKLALAARRAGERRRLNAAGK